jgi:hypothetical protein
MTGMAARQLIKIKCQRCGKDIYTVALPALVRRPSYKKYGKICKGCLSREEEESLGREQIEETLHAARKYRIVGKIRWRELDLGGPEERILRFIAARIYYTSLLPALSDITREFPEIDVEFYLRSLEDRGLVQPLW